MLISSPSSIGLAIRAARPEDAEAISACYFDAYTSSGSSQSEKAYPFPQFMDPKWLEEAVTRDTVCWMVADTGDEVVGSIGAVRNIGTPDDRISELFGLVIREQWREKRIATRLFVALTESLADSCFLIAETRTATEGGWRTVKRHGFIPCGIEPFAHTTPVGSEPMLLLGHFPRGCSAQRHTNGHTSTHVAMLAEKVLAKRQLNPLSSKKEQGYPTSAQSWHEIRKYLVPAHESVEPRNFDINDEGHEFRTVEDVALERRLKLQWQEHGPYLSGIVGLNRLEGEDPVGVRYSDKSFVGYIGPHPVACSRVVWDHLDRRARILSLYTLFHGLQGLMLSAIVDWLQAGSGNARVAIVVDVLADSPVLHGTLERIGFFPTVYYPGFVAGVSGRVDVVQFTRLSGPGSDCTQNLRWIDKVNWPEAREISEVVTRLARAAKTNTTS